MINQDHTIFSDFSDNSKPIFFKFEKAIFYLNPNRSENFLKISSVFQKLDHLTCSKLKLRCPSITALK